MKRCFFLLEIFMRVITEIEDGICSKFVVSYDGIARFRRQQHNTRVCVQSSSQGKTIPIRSITIVVFMTHHLSCVYGYISTAVEQRRRRRRWRGISALMSNALARYNKKNTVTFIGVNMIGQDSPKWKHASRVPRTEPSQPLRYRHRDPLV